MIEAHDVAKSFGDTVALTDLSFTAADGQVTGLLGPNGAGKTTSMRILSGLMRADSGRFLVDGVDPSVDPTGSRRLLGVLPDSEGLYSRLTCREQLRYFGRLLGLGGAALERRIDGLVARLDMTAIADRRAHGYSRGERRKLSLARALLHDPPNVLLDEPTNGLDVTSARTVRRLIEELEGAGRCVVLSSHVMHEVAELCDRVVVVAGGRVVAAGSPAELVERTGGATLEDAFVSLIGSDEGMVH